MRGDIDLIFEKTKGSFPDFFRANIAHVIELSLGLDLTLIERVVAVLEDARDRGSTIFVIGNGGSASAASHFVLDLANRGGATPDKPFRMISLSDSSAYITALGNDDGYEYVFAHQLRNLYRPGDVLLCISASGNSPNILRAIDYVHERAGTSISLVGFDGGLCKSKSTHTILVPSTKGEYGPVETVHLMVLHIIIDFLFLKKKKSTLWPHNQ